MYLFVTFLLVLINLGIFACRQTLDFPVMIASIGTSFIPFAGFIGLLIFPADMPVEFILFAGLITGVFSGIVTYLLIEIILSHLPLVDT